MLHPPITLNCNGRLLLLRKPLVMGILNMTPDSFYDGGRYRTPETALFQAEKMLSEGAAILDIGGMSSRPGAELGDINTELNRVLPVVEAVRRAFPEAILSIDTVRAEVAKEAVAAGASIVNDISAGQFDEAMYPTVAALGVPYVLMHLQGTPQTMQINPTYENVVEDLLHFFVQQIAELRQLGVKDIIVDVGFGFGKTLEHNYQLLRQLADFHILDCPLLVGISRKSMICKVLKVNPDKALNGTTALHFAALQNGARLLRTHDVREAVETIELWQAVEGRYFTGS